MLGQVARNEGDLDRCEELTKEGLVLADEFGEPRVIGWGKLSLGLVELGRGRPAEAREHLRRSATVFHEVGLRRGLVWSVLLIGVAEMNSGNPEGAARLFAAADGLRGPRGAPVPAVEQAQYDEWIAALAGQLGADRLKAVWEEGAALEVDEAVALALSPTSSPVAAQAESA